MSLGLGDIKKKRRSVVAPTSTETKTEWSARSFTARPWTETNTPRPANRRAVDSDGTMNADWIATVSVAGPGDFLDLSPLVRLQQTAEHAEGWVRERLEQPIEALLSICSLVGLNIPRR